MSSNQSLASALALISCISAASTELTSLACIVILLLQSLSADASPLLTALTKSWAAERECSEGVPAATAATAAFLACADLLFRTAGHTNDEASEGERGERGEGEEIGGDWGEGNGSASEDGKDRPSGRTRGFALTPVATVWGRTRVCAAMESTAAADDAADAEDDDVAASLEGDAAGAGFAVAVAVVVDDAGKAVALVAVVDRLNVICLSNASSASSSSSFSLS